MVSKIREGNGDGRVKARNTEIARSLLLLIGFELFDVRNFRKIYFDAR